MAYGNVTGSLIGTGIGSFGGPLTAGIGGMIGGGIGSMFDKGGGSQSAQGGGYQWDENPQYSNVENSMGNYWDYLGKSLQAMQMGQPTEGFQQFRANEEYQRKNALRGSYYGAGAGAAGSGPYTGEGAGGYGVNMNPGANYFRPGVLDTQMSQDVRVGRRGAGAGSNYAKQLAIYGQSMNDIDMYLSQLGYADQQNNKTQILNAFQNSGNIRGPEGAWHSFEGTSYQPSGMESSMNTLGQLVPYLSNLSSSGGGGSTYGESLLPKSLDYNNDYWNRPLGGGTSQGGR